MKLIRAFVLLILAVILFGGSVFAVTPSRDIATTTLGATTITNGQNFNVLKLIGIQVAGVQPVVSTGTVTHVQDGITNTIGTIITSAGGGGLTATGTVYVFKTGELGVSGLGTNTGASVRFVFDNYP